VAGARPPLSVAPAESRLHHGAHAAERAGTSVADQWQTPGAEALDLVFEAQSGTISPDLHNF